MRMLKKDMDEMEAKAQVLKALSHPIRLCIAKGLMECDGCNVSGIQECFNLPQSTVSQHLANLRSAGIITGKRSGVSIEYSVTNQFARRIIANLN